MLRLIGVKLLLLVPILLLVSMGTFILVTLVPGNPEVEVLGPNASAEDYIRVRNELGLDDPIVKRYGDWFADTIRGDLGKNLLPPVEDVWQKIKRAFPVSIQIAAMAVSLSLLIAIPLSMMAAYFQNSPLDRSITGASFAFIALPSFLLGVVVKLIFALNLKWLPDSLWVRPTENLGDNIRHSILPVMTVALAEISVFTRLLRNDLTSTLQDDFILAAKAKGMRGRHIMVREALRPSSFSLITLAGVSLGRLIGGTVIVEQLFSLPGVGSVVVAAAGKKDYPVVQAGVLLIAVFYVTINTVIDIAYSFLDPRIRRGRI